MLLVTTAAGSTSTIRNRCDTKDGLGTTVTSDLPLNQYLVGYQAGSIREEDLAG